jgi:hypothetical protein
VDGKHSFLSGEKNFFCLFSVQNSKQHWGGKSGKYIFFIKFLLSAYILNCGLVISDILLNYNFGMVTVRVGR